MLSAIPKIASGLVLVVLLAGLSACSADPLKVPLTFEKNVQMPRDTGAPAFDLLTLDPGAGRLYVAHGSANTLEIVDVKSASIIGSVPNLPGIKGTALSSDPNVIFTANGTDGSVSVVDVKLLKVLDNIKMGTKYLQILLDSTGGDEHLAVASYYQGLAPTQAGVFYPDTSDYVNMIFRVRDTYWPE